MSNVSMPEEPPRRPPRRGASILSDTDGDGSDGSDDDDDDRRFAGGADADSPSVPAQPDSDEDDRDEEALDAQIEALRRQIAAGRLTPSAASEMDQVAEDPVDELLGSERWDAGALAAADNDTLDALIDRLAKSRPQTDPMSMLEREEAAARRMKVQTDLMAYLHELRRRAKVDFPPDFAELVEELVANATKRDAQLRAVGLRGKVAAIDDDDRYDRYDDDAGSGGGGRMPDPWTNPEPGLDMISAEDLDPKIRAGLEKIRRYDEMLLAKEAEQRMVEQETLERAGGGGGGGDGSSSVTVHVGAGDDGDDGDDRDELAGGLEARVARRRARRLRKIARLRRTLRGDDAERMGGAAARNAANIRGAQRLAKLTEEEDALAERLLEEFAREEEGPRSGTRGIDSSTAAPVDVDADADMYADVDDDMDADLDADARSVAASTRSLVSSATANPFAVHRAIAGVVHPGAGTAFGSLDVDAHGHVLDEDARRLAEIERALGEIASGRGTAAETQPAETQPAALERPASAVSSSPAPSSASALARRLGAPSVSAGVWDDDGEKENDSVRTRGGFDSQENYLEDARGDRELREVDETVDAALRRMKTKGAFPERLTAEEMRRLVDECRSEQGT